MERSVVLFTQFPQYRYKVLIKTYHPDLYKGDKVFANEKTKEITQAYKILVNPTTRNDYDMLLYDEYLESNKNYDTIALAFLFYASFLQASSPLTGKRVSPNFHILRQVCRTM